MGIVKWFARRGTVGGTARWAAQLYLSIRAGNPRATLDEIMEQMVTVRYFSPSDLNIKAQILNQVQGGQLSGLGALVVMILVFEANYSKNTSENRAMFGTIINEELEKTGVPQEAIFDSSRALAGLGRRLN